MALLDTIQPVRTSAGAVMPDAAPGTTTAATAQPWTTPVTTPAAPAPAAMAQAPAPFTAATATPGLLGPTNNAVAASNTPSLLSDQVNKVTDPNSPIMRRAIAAANEESNSKNLLNSSMGIGAAQNAVLNAAVPIATGDINALNTAGLATQQQQSQASLSNAQQANAMQTAQAQLTSQANLQNAQQSNAVNTAQNQLISQANLQNAQAQNTQIMSQLNQANQVQLAGLNNKYQSFLNTNQNASTLYNNALAQIGNIQSNPNLDAATKSAQIQQMMIYLNSGLSMMSSVSGLNLRDGLDFGSAPATLANINQPTQAAADAAAAAKEAERNTLLYQLTHPAQNSSNVGISTG